MSEGLVLLHDRDVLALNALILRQVKSETLVLLVLLQQLLSMTLALRAWPVLRRRGYIL